MNNIEFNDFYKVPNIKFDISKLKSDLEKILNKKKFNSLGIKNFGAIPLNQIPGDKESTKVIMLEVHTGLYQMRQARKL